MATTMFPEARTAVVTGAGSARGIGRAAALRFAAEGWTVAVLDLDIAAAEETAALVRDAGASAIAVGVDVSDESSVAAAIGVVEQELPPVVALINAAGISDPTPFFELSGERFRRVLEINTVGTFLVTQRMAAGMRDRGIGRIVSISSTAAQDGGGNYSKASYAASKAAIEGMTRSVARELAPHGVTANAIAPATIDTDIMGGPLTEDRLPAFLARMPVGRVGTVDEVAALLVFLSGPDAGYITGATYNVNGGLRIG